MIRMRILLSVLPVVMLIGGCRDNPSQRSLHEAAEKNDIAKVKALLEEGTDVNKRDESNKTALCIAAREGNEEIVKLLINNGADVNTKADEGVFPLFLAVLYDRQDVAEILLSHGADINAVCGEGFTVLNIACCKNMEMARFLIGHGAKASIQNAAAIGDIELIKDLLSSGADIEARDNLGCSALLLAAATNQIETVKFLLNHGADVNAKDNKGATALHVAAGLGNPDMIKLLVTHNADVNAKDDEGMTALHHAVTQLDISSEERKFVNLNLNIAVIGDWSGAVKLLLENGADSESRDNNGQTPLALATKRGHTQSALLLSKDRAR